MSVAVEERYHVPGSQVWPGSGGRQQGRVHLHVLEPLVASRLKRQTGECLCSKKRGSYERTPECEEYRCESCARVAKRLGIEWPSAVAARRREGWQQI